MAPLDPAATQRWYYTYANSRNEHTLTLRGNADAINADADAAFSAIVGAIGTFFCFSTVLRVETSVEGSNVRNPTGSDLIGSTFGSGACTADQAAMGMSVTGKSLAGKRARLFLFGWNQPLGNYRLDAGEDSSVAALIGALDDLGNVPVAIDGLTVTWNAYVNIKPNDHWVSQLR
jgi:hypothetical protein